ncbi:HD domain-containing protein [Pseudomonas sp. NFXW11]|uniref:HD domain-containing protein n=1 Tax=Pseudomonas sp. NFXW11 TaxID=2819531 RepID=UPI003CFAD722
MTEQTAASNLFHAREPDDLGPLEAVSFAAWARLWTELGATAPSRETYEQLIRHYDEPHRVYHNRQHLAECLQVRRQLNTTCQAPAEIDLALWFHDAIYDPLRSDNELRSAQWLDQVASDSGLAEEVRRRLYELIMVTRHASAPTSVDEAVLVDTDLAILGASIERFEEYDRQVRREYQYVPLSVYRLKRRQVLEGFLGRGRIYTSAPYFEAFERQARENLGRAIGRLD